MTEEELRKLALVSHELRTRAQGLRERYAIGTPEHGVAVGYDDAADRLDAALREMA